MLLFNPPNDYSTLVLALYSGVYPWWFSVSKDVWANWGEHCHLAFLIKDEDGVSYVLLNTEDSKTLLGKCDSRDDLENMKIHIRRHENGGRIYFIEWEAFDLRRNLQRLPISV